MSIAQTGQVEWDPILLAHCERTGDNPHTWMKVYPPDELDGKIVADDRADSLDAASELGRDLLLVDGNVWRRIPDPFWLVGQMGLGQYCFYLAAPTTLASTWGDGRVAGFRLDRLDDALAWTEAFGRHRNRTPAIHGPSGSVVEFDPTYVRRDDLVVETAHLGKQVVSDFSHQIPAMTTAGIGHYAAARDHLDVLAGGQGDAVVVAAFLSEIDGMVGDIRRFGWPTDRAAARDYVLKNVEHLDWRIRRGEAPALAAGLAQSTPELNGIAPLP